MFIMEQTNLNAWMAAIKARAIKRRRVIRIDDSDCDVDHSGLAHLSGPPISTTNEVIRIDDSDCDGDSSGCAQLAGSATATATNTESLHPAGLPEVAVDPANTQAADRDADVTNTVANTELPPQCCRPEVWVAPANSAAARDADAFATVWFQQSGLADDSANTKAADSDADVTATATNTEPIDIIVINEYSDDVSSGMSHISGPPHFQISNCCPLLFTHIQICQD